MLQGAKTWLLEFLFSPLRYFYWVLLCDKPWFCGLAGAHLVVLMGISHTLALVWELGLLNMALPGVLVFDSLVTWF